MSCLGVDSPTDEARDAETTETAMKYKNDEIIICPNPECGKPLEDGKYGEAHNFVVHAMKGFPMKLGAASQSEHECGWCEQKMIATRISADEIEVLPVS